jgi:hypothetical protein
LPRSVVAVCGGRALKPLADAGVRLLETMGELHVLAAKLGSSVTTA